LELIVNEGSTVKDIHKLVFLAILSFYLIFAGSAFGESGNEIGFIYHQGQSVNGNGFFSTYRDTNVVNLNISNSAHGSGSYSYESNIDAQSEAKYQKGGDFEDRIIVYDESWNSWSMIKINESTDFSYTPIDMKLGKYSYPITFKSNGMDGACFKNHDSGVSINARFDHAEMLHKNLTSELFWSWKQTDDDYRLEVIVDNQSKTKLKLKADFSGNGHFGVLNMNRSQQRPDILIDEDYRGTYSITKSISHMLVYNRKQQFEEWLPCCTGGFSDMSDLDQRQFKSAEGIFDCTCPVQP
jgi:hypothetical protein